MTLLIRDINANTAESRPKCVKMGGGGLDNGHGDYMSGGNVDDRKGDDNGDGDGDGDGTSY